MTQFLKYLIIFFSVILFFISPVIADTTTLVSDFSFGTEGEGDGQFLSPRCVVISQDETVYITDTTNCRVQAFAPDGTFLTKWNDEDSPDGTFDKVYGITVSPDGSIYTTDYGKNQVQQFTNSGTYIRSFGTSGSGKGELNYPQGIAVNSTGFVFVADQNNNRVEVFSPEGEYHESWSSPTGMPADFLLPSQVVIGKDDTVYVGLYETNKIYCFSPEKALIQSWQLPYQYRTISGISLGPDGYLYAVRRGGSPYGDSAMVYICMPDGSLQTMQIGENSVIYGIGVDEEGGIFCTHSRNSDQKYVTRFVKGTKTPGLPIPELGWSYPLTQFGTEDNGNDIFLTADGGSIETGNINVDLDSDMLVIKRDTNGIVEWINNYGGDRSDGGRAVIETRDGNYAIIGYTWSEELTNYHGNEDIWVVMIDSEGYVLWEKCYGGTSQDNGYGILETDDENFILTGFTESDDGDVSGNHGESDVWVVKINPEGDILWQKCYGGTNYDMGYCITPTLNDGIILTGYTESDDGDVSGNHGEYDIWVVKINSQGEILWQKCYGGSFNDVGYAIIPTDTGGYLLTGHTYSDDGDITGNHGAPDLVGIEIDSEGNILWQKCYGGTNSDYGLDVMTYNGNYIFVGHTGSIDGDVTGYHGYRDVWVIQTDAKGNIKWTRSCGGSSSDSGVGSISRGDGTYVVTGSTYSRDGDVSNSDVTYDLWTFMIDEKEADFSASVLSGPAPLTVSFTGMTSSGIKTDSWNWYFGDGGISHEERPVHQYTAPGTYTVRMEVAGSGFDNTVEKPGYIVVT